MSGTRTIIYDTTLRDGMQGQGISYTLEDKVQIALAMDEFGIDYIEGGFPLSNRKEAEFFQRMRKEKLPPRAGSWPSARRGSRRARRPRTRRSRRSCTRKPPRSSWSERRGRRTCGKSCRRPRRRTWR